jgi:hypothetical protein
MAASLPFEVEARVDRPVATEPDGWRLLAGLEVLTGSDSP